MKPGAVQALYHAKRSRNKIVRSGGREYMHLRNGHLCVAASIIRE